MYHCRTELNRSPKKSDSPSVPGNGLSKGGGVDFRLFPIFLLPGAVEDT